MRVFHAVQSQVILLGKSTSTRTSFFSLCLLANSFHSNILLLRLPLPKSKSRRAAREMASLAASTAAASLGVSEMLGNHLNFNNSARSVPLPSYSPSTFKAVALFSKKKAPPPKPKPSAASPASDELAKWYGESSIYLPICLLNSLTPILGSDALFSFLLLLLLLALFVFKFQVLTEEFSCPMDSWTDQKSQSTSTAKLLESKYFFPLNSYLFCVRAPHFDVLFKE